MAHILEFDADNYDSRLVSIDCARHGVRNAVRFKLEYETHDMCYGCFVENMVGFLG